MVAHRVEADIPNIAVLILNHTNTNRRTSELIPLCHPLPLDAVNIDIRLHGDSVAVIQCECRTHHTTGVEMEALTGATIAALTIYDMTKAVSHKIRIEDTILLSKSGGKRNM